LVQQLYHGDSLTEKVDERIAVYDT